MSPYNKKLNTDINNLKKLHAKKDKTDFKRAKAEIMKRHNISKATVYREMKKDIPGSYKTPNYSTHKIPITDKEKRMVRELLVKQHTLQDICLIMEKQTGESYNWDRVDKIRKELDHEPLPPSADSPLVKGRQKPSQKPLPYGEGKPGTGGEGLKQDSPLVRRRQNGSENESAFGDDIKLVLMNILNVENMDYSSHITFQYKGVDITLDKQAIDDIVTILANSTDAGKDSILEVTRVRLKHMLAEKARIASSRGFAISIRDINDMNTCINKFDRAVGKSFTPNHEVLTAVVKEFAPGASDVMIFMSAQKHQKEIAGSTEDIVPDIRPIQALAHEEMKKSM